MLQLIDRRARIGMRPTQTRLADPDLLLEITKRAENSRPLSLTSDLVQLFSRILHDIRMGGAWKRTSGGRLSLTESALIRHISPRHRAKVVLLDLGASDGITTVDLVQSLRAEWRGKVTAFLTDLNLWLLRYQLGPLVEYRAGDGEPIMARIGPVGLRLARQRQEQGSGFSGLARWYLRLGRLRGRMRLDAAIPLVNPLATSDPDIVIKELNCLEGCDDFAGRFAAIRASNVLNQGYFTDSQIQQAVRHVHSYLAEDGCLVVSRNADQSNREMENGSVWLRRTDRLEWVEDFGNGSEIKAIVNSWRVGRG